MQICQRTFYTTSPLQPMLSELAAIEPQFVLAFGCEENLSNEFWHQELSRLGPNTLLLGCSTAGEIATTSVSDNTLCLTAVRLDKGLARTSSEELQNMDDSMACGERLARKIEPELDGHPLRAVWAFGPGVQINGSGLVEGMKAAVAHDVVISGGLAGDAGAFARTLTLGPMGVSSRQVVALALYGQDLRLGNASLGGWEAFGPARRVTRCDRNVLHELDGQRALDVYKLYLGHYARDLPASGLLFPFEMISADGQPSGLIRTILGVDEASGSLTLAGEIDPKGSLRLMHSSSERLIEAAGVAVQQACDPSHNPTQPSLAVLVSCVGRKLVMGDRIEEEVEEVARHLGPFAVLTGFYSYGEISGSKFYGDCRLHNQTMTITVLSESC